MKKNAVLLALVFSIASCSHRISSKCPATDLHCRGREIIAILASQDYMDAEMLFYKQGRDLHQPEEQVMQDFLGLHHLLSTHGLPADSSYTIEDRPGGHFLFQHIGLAGPADTAGHTVTLTLVYTDYRHGGPADIMGYYIK